ncbi:MAG: hypothetical protein V7603_5053 [Micromonosporaceae bacterium]
MTTRATCGTTSSPWAPPPRGATWPPDDVPSEHSDHFWLAALGVQVLVRRRDDVVFVAVNGEGIDPVHGALVVQVNEGEAVAYGAG